MLIPGNGRTGVICETWALQAVVISVPPWRDGNDRRFQRYPSPNDTNTLMGWDYSLEPVGICRGFEMKGGFVP